MGWINSSHNQPWWPWHFFERNPSKVRVRRRRTSRSSRNDLHKGEANNMYSLSVWWKEHTSFFGLHLEGFFRLNTTNLFGRNKKSTNIAPPFFSGEKHVRFFKKMVLLPPPKNPMLLPGESFTFATPKSLQRSQFQTKILSEGYLVGGFNPFEKY